jgi:hypothetical protein
MPMKKSVFATIIVSLYLLIYHLAFNFAAPADIIISMFLLAPFLMIWMSVSIMKDKSTEVAELKEGEEWGYQDRSRERFL